MNTVRILAAIAIVSISTGSIADDDSKVDAAKQAAIDTCIKAAEEKYGEAKILRNPRKTTVSSKRGYKIHMRVGARGKTVACIAFNKGGSMFTTS